MFEFLGNMFGFVLNFECDLVGVVIFGEYEYILEGDIVKMMGCIFEVLVGLEFVGCVVDVFGNLIDGKGLVNVKLIDVIEKIVLGVIWCKLVLQLVQMGIKLIDVMVLIGCGQCELIIGDCQCGKIVVVFDVIINQKGKDLICIYVVIGQKVLLIMNVVCKFEEMGVMEYMIVVVVLVLDLVVMQYLVLYVGCMMGEYFCDCG